MSTYRLDVDTGSWIASDFKHGERFSHGLNCIIENDVVVGDGVVLGHCVHLKSGTRILSDVNLADRCHTTGLCIIGNHVQIRTGSCISKSVIVDDWAFIGAGIMSSHTKHVYHGRPRMEKRQLVTRVGYGAIVGSRANLTAGIVIAPGVIVGYGSNVVKDLHVPHGVYVGNPARFVSRVTQDDEWYIETPEDYEPHEFDVDMLRQYLPHYRKRT